MIVEYVRYVVPEKECDAFERAQRRAQKSLDSSPHCLGYELTRCAESASYYVLRIEWDSVDGHREGFRSSPEFPAFIAALRPFAYFIVEMRHYEPTSVRSRRRAGDDASAVSRRVRRSRQGPVEEKARP